MIGRQSRLRRKESETIQTQIQEWSTIDDLGDALNRYIALCGYLPLAEDLSAASLITAWESKHPGSDIWPTVWSWAESSPTVLAEYRYQPKHFCTALG